MHDLCKHFVMDAKQHEPGCSGEFCRMKKQQAPAENGRRLLQIELLFRRGFDDAPKSRYAFPTQSVSRFHDPFESNTHNRVSADNEYFLFHFKFFGGKHLVVQKF